MKTIINFLIALFRKPKELTEEEIFKLIQPTILEKAGWTYGQSIIHERMNAKNMPQLMDGIKKYFNTLCEEEIVTLEMLKKYESIFRKYNVI